MDNKQIKIKSNILIADSISQNISVMPENYIVCHEAVIAREGDLYYTPEEFGAEEEVETLDNGKIKLIKNRDILKSEETIASYNGKPLTIEHPTTFINKDNYLDYKDKIIGSVNNVKAKEIDGVMSLVADLIVQDPNAIDAIMNKEIRELSSGHTSQNEFLSKGVWLEKKIIGNHVALTREARAGHLVAINDSAKEVEMSKEESENKEAKEKESLEVKEEKQEKQVKEEKEEKVSVGLIKSIIDLLIKPEKEIGNKAYIDGENNQTKNIEQKDTQPTKSQEDLDIEKSLAEKFDHYFNAKLAQLQIEHQKNVDSSNKEEKKELVIESVLNDSSKSIDKSISSVKESAKDDYTPFTSLFPNGYDFSRDFPSLLNNSESIFRNAQSKQNGKA